LISTNTFVNLVDPNKNIVIAYSGGGDSSALLHFCYELKQKNILLGNLSAIHINHSLNNEAEVWEKHCKNFCEERDIQLYCKKIFIDSKKSGLESAARQERYKIFANRLQSGDQLLLAHHADDVAETILYRLFRGTGLDGLQGPLKKRKLGDGVIIRPLLPYTKATLNAYLKDKKINFISDESNFNSDQDRNFIRNEVLELVQNRWPKAAQQIQKTSVFASQYVYLIESLLFDRFGESLLKNKLERQILTSLDEPICAEVLRYWIKNNNIAVPNQRILNEIMKAFIRSKPSLKTCVDWSRADQAQNGGVLIYVNGQLVLNKK
tara:strand:+ start:858 stop:1823 length:966 start_codon:yes stop_codon:yes gene_type:complete